MNVKVLTILQRKSLFIVDPAAKKHTANAYHIAARIQCHLKIGAHAHGEG
jgi:hypothetical protein